MDAHGEGLVEIGRWLQRSGYRFVTVTPATHARVVARDPGRVAADLRDVFGWNRPFTPELLPAELLACLQRAHACTVDGDRLRATVRFSTACDGLYVHSGFPTEQRDAVFFGPDTYRFCTLLQRRVPPCRRAVDVGCGTGVGGLSIADRAEHVVLSDVNEHALRLARVNARLADVEAEIVRADVLAGIDGEIDLVIANPPYLIDGDRRVYRDGGGEHGEALGVRMAREAMDRLVPGGRLVLYTGSAIVDGHDTFRAAVSPALAGATELHYEELDPDVFGEELERPSYADVDRIAVIALVARRG